MLRLLTITCLCVAAAPLEAQIDARMLRFPDVSATHITFVYAGDIWVVAKSGGVAHRLSSPRGEETFPRFSPDGSRIAFSGNYDGNTDVYVVPTMGGAPVRVTHHPMADRLVDWTPDGHLLIATSMASERQRYSQFWRVAPTGGLPERLAVPYGEFGSLSPDGRMIAYTPKARDFRTWKRYRGGWAPDIMLFDLQNFASENITSHAANDGHPMWHGRTIYFLSDRGANQRYNLWAYDRDTKQTRQVTRFSDYDITFPAIGPAEIVFEAGGRLHLLDLETEQVRDVAVDVVTDQATLKPRTERVTNLIQYAAVSPSGARALFEGRGEVFSVPAEHGPILNLTRSSGVAERYPAWSPDGRQVAYWSDRSGEYELTVRPADGTGAERKVTSYGPGFRYRIFWSPDSRKVAFIDQTMTIRVVDVASGRTTDVDKDFWLYHGGLNGFTVSWSADSRWLAYSRGLEHRNGAIFAFDTREGHRHQLTSGYYNDVMPVFDPDGRYLYFYTNRSFRPVYSDVDNSWVYPNATAIAAASLRPDVPSPLAARNDAEGEEEVEVEGEKKDSTAVVTIAPADFERRVVVLPPEAGNFGELAAVSGKVVYRRQPLAGVRDGKSPIVYYDLKEREEKTVLDDANGFVLTADGKKLAVRQDGRYAIIELKPAQKFEQPLRTAELETTVDPRAEWRQLFADAWRFERDYFYDPNMHGVDWPAMREHYGRLLSDAVTRWDVNFVIGEMIAELNASHTYRGGGDTEGAPGRNVGLLGVDWEVANGRYRLAQILMGAPWDTVRSPLAEPGVGVSAGDYVLAVNGVPLDPARDPWAPFEGLAGKAVALTVNSRPTVDGARTVVVEAMNDETRLRHLAWIEANRRRVDEATEGRAGYIYVPNTGIEGQTELVRQFQAQFMKDALVIDERFNSGGQIPDRFVELLDRPPLVFFAVRDGHDWQWPPVAHFGPKVMLINGWSGSGGDAFPHYFKQREVGPLIGERTWGGLIGISGVPPLVDGGGVTVPTFRQYNPDGTWFPEGHGVDPDIPVADDPTALARGQDPQLERAIQEVLRLLETQPPVRPKRPPYENRTAEAVTNGR